MSAARSSRTTRMTFRIRTCGIRWFKRRCTLQFPWFRLARQDSAKVATVASSNPAQALNLRGRSMRPVMSRVRTRRATTKGFRVRLRDADSVQDANVWQLSTGAQRVDRGGAHSELLRLSCNRKQNVLDTRWTHRFVFLRCGMEDPWIGRATVSSEIEALGSEWSAVEVRESWPSELPRRRSPVRTRCSAPTKASAFL